MKTILQICLLGIFIFPCLAIGDEVKERVQEPVKDAISIMQKTQKEEEDWRLLQVKLTEQFDSLQLQVDHLMVTKDKLVEEVALTEKRIALKKQQLADSRRIEEEMEPFLNDLAARMITLPERQLPFLVEERNKRMSKLLKSLQDPDVSMSEKYRKAMEVLRIEAEFGLTIETSQEMVEIEGREMLVNVFRLGRIGLYFVSLDETKCGFYNLGEQQWQLLSGEYISSLQTAVAIADKRRPVEFIDVPLGRMLK